jgi:hypothetical protein
MKKIIIIQNDYPGAGKSTVVRLFRRYLSTHKVDHRFIVLGEDRDSIEPGAQFLDLAAEGLEGFLEAVDHPGITIMEASSGAGEELMRLYDQHEMDTELQSLNAQMTVVLPVNNERESYEAVVEAADTFRDNVQYLIAHSSTSAYSEDSSPWDRSYAARVMDMFEAVELRFPEATIEMEQSFRAKQTTLAKAMLAEDVEATFGKEAGKWIRRAIGQVEMARQYVFGDHFRTLAEPDKPTRKARGPKKKELVLA